MKSWPRNYELDKVHQNILCDHSMNAHFIGKKQILTFWSIMIFSIFDYTISINPHTPVAQKVANEVVFWRFQGEGVEFFLIGPHWPPSDFWCASSGSFQFKPFQFQKMKINEREGSVKSDLKNSTSLPWKRRKTISFATFCATGVWGLR